MEWVVRGGMDSYGELRWTVGESKVESEMAVVLGQESR